MRLDARPLTSRPRSASTGEYAASLDGVTLDGELIVEIKCPYKGQGSALWQAVEAGEVPEHYRMQAQHQLMVSGAAFAHLWVFDGKVGLLREIRPEAPAAEVIRQSPAAAPGSSVFGAETLPGPYTAPARRPKTTKPSG